MQHPRRSAVRRLALVTALCLSALAVPAVASAHTGGIGVRQDCDHGTQVVAQLDDNVADTATWELRIRGTVVDSGTGPGPAALGPYPAGSKAGDARLTIDYGQEENVYTVDWGVTEPCSIDVKPAGSRPGAHITGPCGDPLYRWTLRAGSYRTAFTIHAKLYGKGWRTWIRHIDGGERFTSGYKHIEGGSLITISARGKVVASERSARGGWYGACPR